MYQVTYNHPITQKPVTLDRETEDEARELAYWAARTTRKEVMIFDDHEVFDIILPPWARMKEKEAYHG